MTARMDDVDRVMHHQLNHYARRTRFKAIRSALRSMERASNLFNAAPSHLLSPAQILENQAGLADIDRMLDDISAVILRASDDKRYPQAGKR
jgi:hypothetical protein